MFKKPLGQLKTSAPIRASDRRKLKQRVATTFSVNPEDGDLLVPDGILTAKFFTYAKEPGTLYLDPVNGNPLWFTIGRGSEDLIPTIYMLWKLNDANLLPSILAPSAVIPILSGGADLMIPGVITHSPPELAQNQLVAIHQVSSSKNDNGAKTRIVSPPVAVGRMAVSSQDLKTKRDKDEKGKAVLVLHIWKDHLWEMGDKSDVPSSTPLGYESHGSENDTRQIEGGGDKEEAAERAPEESIDPLPKISYTPQEITDLLTKCFIHAIVTQLSNVPNSTFPVPSSQLYSTYILPSRPAYPSSVVMPSAASSLVPEDEALDPAEIHIDPSDITIKASTHKSLSTFLKALEKASLLTLKPAKQKSGGGDLVVTSVNATHPDVVAYKAAKPHYVTVAEIEAKTAKRQARKEQMAKEQQRHGREIEAKQVWKPHLKSLALFEDMGASTSELYTLNDIRTLLNNYLVSKDLINKQDQTYINLNAPLLAVVTTPAEQGKKPGKGDAANASQPGTVVRAPLEFMKRDEVMKKVQGQMQGWYEVKAEGKEVIPRKGELQPIKVVVRMIHGGRRGTTSISGFEPYLVIDAYDMAEKFRKLCAGSTSVSDTQLPGTNQHGLRVVVQGKQVKPVVDYLIERGIPKKWIEINEAVGKK